MVHRPCSNLTCPPDRETQAPRNGCLSWGQKPAPQAPAFDTLKAARNLKNAEFGDKQAVTLVETIQDAQNELATKADLANTELALRTDMEKMGASLLGEIQKLRGEMEARFNKLSWQILTATGGIVVANTSILGLMILFK